MKRPARWVVTMVITGASLCGTVRPASAETPSPAAVQDAQRHFHRGVELYTEGDLDAALVEFTRAYQTVPAYKILFNLGQIAWQRQDYVAALAHFRAYLEQGGPAVPQPRRREVEGEIVRLEARVGRLAIEVREPGAEVLIDDISVGSTPLAAAVPVNVGRRRVQVIFAGGERQARVIEVAGGELARVSFPSPVPPVAPVPRNPPAPTPVLLSLAQAPSPAPVRRRWTWVAWTTAGVLGAAAGTSGWMALEASGDLQRTRETFPADAGDLEAQSARGRTLSWVADGLLAGALVSAAVATYLTVRGE